jgi:hypothetical protein
MSEVQTDSLSHQRNASRVKRDEEELQALLKEAGVLDEDSADETEEEETVEEVSDSTQLSDAPVPSEGDTEQEEEPKAEAQEDGLSAEEKNFKKRYGDLRRHTQDKEKEFQAKLDKLEAQLQAATKNELVLPKSEDEVEAWAKKYPDVAGIVEAIADKKASERSSELDGRLKEIEELRTQARREKSESELMRLHPDFADIRADEAFHKWAEKQPKVYQDALYENAEDVQSVARVIDMYKSDNNIKTKKTVSTADKDAASSVKSKRTAVDANDSSSYLSESQVDKMSIQEYEKRQEEIMDAQRKGKFIYDITKR